MTRRLPLVLLALAALGGAVWMLAQRAPEPSTLRSGPALPVRADAQRERPAPATALVAPEPVPDTPREDAAASSAPAAPVRPGRTAALPTAPEEGPLVVVALDRRTGEPLRFVEVEFAAPHHPRARVPTDRQGRARSPDTLPAGGLRLTARDLLTGRRLERKAILHQPDAKGGAAERTWELDLGPTYGLRVDAGEAPLDDPEAGPLRARLRTSRPDGEAHDWSWCELTTPDDDGTRWMRYTRIEAEPAPGTPVRLLVEFPGTPFDDELSVPAAAGLHEGLEVALRSRFGILRGRVTDARGFPIEARVVVLGPASGADEKGELGLQAATDPSGRYELDRVPPGTHLALVLSPLGPQTRAQVGVEEGQVLLRDFVLDVPQSTGKVSGTLIARPGGEEPTAMLRLEPVERGEPVRWTLTQFTLFSDPDGPDRSAYEFENVPLGRYRLRALGFDGRTYGPSEREVLVPATGVDFGEVDGEPPPQFLVRVLDQRSGEPLEGAGIVLGLEDLWFLEVEDLPEGPVPVPRDLACDLVVGAPGHVPVRCSLADAVGDGEVHRLDVRLRRGHGAGLLVLPVEHALVRYDGPVGGAFLARGVPGARVVVQGETAGTVAPDGVALIEAGAPIESFHVEAPGWSTVAVQRFRGHAETPDGLGFVLMTRE